MSIFRTQNQVPEVYPNMSRDFQLLGRSLDLVQNSNRYDISNITDVLNTDVCDNSLLPLLQLKEGFYSDKLIPDDELRVILKAFPHIKFYKGSIIGIRRAINTYLKIRPNKLDSIHVINKQKSADADGNEIVENKYTILILFTEQADDLFILDEILKFIVPPGYSIKYSYVVSGDRFERTVLDVVDSVYYAKTKNSVWSMVSSDDQIIDIDNHNIRDIVGSEDTNHDEYAEEFIYSIKHLGQSGLISRLRSSVNVGEVSNSTLDFNRVSLRRQNI